MAATRKRGRPATLTDEQRQSRSKAVKLVRESERAALLRLRDENRDAYNNLLKDECKQRGLVLKERVVTSWDFEDDD